MNTITVSKNTINKMGGVVVLPIKEYRKMQAAIIPTYYLHGKSARALDKLVKEGLQNYKTGKTKVIKSLTELD